MANQAKILQSAEIFTFKNEKLFSKIVEQDFYKYLSDNNTFILDNSIWNELLDILPLSFIFKNNQLKLSPAYDILNVSAIKGQNKDQVTLTIKNKIKRIKIDNFSKAIFLLNLHFGFKGSIKIPIKKSNL